MLTGYLLMVGPVVQGTWETEAEGPTEVKSLRLA